MRYTVREEKKGEGQMERTLKAGGIYRHFKGTLYRVLALARHTETDEELVVYQALDGGTVYARPKEMFLSPVDKEKYPSVSAQYRFEEMEK